MLAAQASLGRGRVTESGCLPRRSRKPHSTRAWLLLAPAGGLISVLVICTLLVLRLSFGTKDAEWSGWTLSNYAMLDQRLYMSSLVATIRLALTSSILAVLLAFPISLFMARTRNAVARRVVLMCVLFPMLMSLLLQSWGWIVILGPNGLLNSLSKALGLTKQPLPLLFNEFSVLLGLVQTTLPLAVLPIASAIQNIPRALEEAAGVLGASRWRVYVHIIVPMAFPGIVAASLLIFGFNVGAFVVPLLLGGLRVTTVAVLIRDQMGPLLNWPLGAAASVVLIAIALTVQGAYSMMLSRGPNARQA